MPELKIKITDHAVERFRERVFPDSTVKECRQFLEENASSFEEIRVDSKKKRAGEVIVTYKVAGKEFCFVCVPSRHKHIFRALTTLSKTPSSSRTRAREEPEAAD